MKRRIIGAITAITLAAAALPATIFSENALADIYKPNPINAHESLDRGLVAMKTDEGVYLSWRLQADEDDVYGTGTANVSFDIYRDGSKIATESDTTNYIDTEGTLTSAYEVVVSGAATTGKTVTAFSSGSNYFDIEIDKPASTYLPKTATYKSAGGSSYTGFSDEDGNEIKNPTQSSDYYYIEYDYTANDASAGDLDGDGDYEIVLKWDCASKDNSQTGITGEVFLDGYDTKNGKLWRISLGQNIRAGAHYTQFLVYDFDGDGKAEIMCKTAPGSKDSAGNYVTAASHIDEIKNITDTINETSYMNNYGYILDGDEFLTIFDGNGVAKDTIYYPNQRVDVSVWGDTNGNRVDRFTATVAYLDGFSESPYGVFMRGYYYGRNGKQRQAACGVKYDGTTLSCDYSFDSFDAANAYDSYTSSASYTSTGVYKGVDGYEAAYSDYYAQGNHNCTVADVDNDGKDEVLTGAMCYEINSSGKLRPKWTTWKGHGDALHIGDYDPTHSGYEFFVVHEEGGGTDHGVTLDYGMSLIDPADGEIIKHTSDSGDTGRGIMANVGAGGYYQFWGAGTFFKGDGNEYVEAIIPDGSSNFRIFWDGDLYDELLDNTTITSWNPIRLGMETMFTADGCTSVNGSKANPSLQADIFGDWREEVIYPLSDSSALRVFTTVIYTEHKMKSLMYDNVYRCGVAAEQTSYNQPPHIGYYVDPGDDITDNPPSVYIPDGATLINAYDAESAAPASYWSMADTTSIGGVNVTIGGYSETENRQSRDKYFAVVNAGFDNKVFKMQNGNYSTVNRAVVASFPDSVTVNDETSAGITFAVKVFDGTKDGKNGAIKFLSDTDPSSLAANNTDYTNIITSINTDILPEGEWGVVRYEFTGSSYYLYLNNKLIDTGSTTAGLPILAMPFCGAAYNVQPYTSMIFDDVKVYTMPAVESDYIYEKGTGSSTAWTSADVSGWTTTGSVTPAYDSSATYGALKYSGATTPASFSATKTFDVDDNAYVTYDIDWAYGGVINASGSQKIAGANDANYTYLQLGSNIVIGWHGAPSYYGVYLSTDGGETFTSAASSTNANHTSRVHALVDMSNDKIISLTFDGTPILSDAGITDGNSVTFGFHRGTTGFYNSSTQPATALNSITVSQMIPSVITEPTSVPTSVPTQAPVEATEAPTATTTSVPVSSPTATPVPVSSPTATPVPVEKIIVNENYQSASTGLFVPTNDVGDATRVSTAIAADSTDTVNNTNTEVITTASNAGNCYAHARYELPEISSNADKVGFNFDVKLGGRAVITIGDGTRENAGSAKQTYSKTGAMFNIGRFKYNDSYDMIGTQITSKDNRDKFSNDIQDLWLSVSAVIDLSDKTVSYTVSDYSTKAVYITNTDVAYLDTDASGVPAVIDFYDYANSSVTKIDNIKITEYTEPEETPSPSPTSKPTTAPTSAPTTAPTAEPTTAPTTAPTVEPTAIPTSAPTAEPTTAPTVKPTTAPTIEPTIVPTTAPTTEPTLIPTEVPTVTHTPAATEAPAATQTPAVTVPPSEVWIDTADSNTAYVRNIDKLPESKGTLLAAVYNDNGSLEKLIIYSVSTEKAYAELSGDFKPTDKVTLMLWGDLASMVPYAKGETIIK